MNHRDKDVPNLFDNRGTLAAFSDGAVGIVVETDVTDEQLASGEAPSDILLPGAVTQLLSLSRKEMLADPEALKAVRKEVHGLEKKGTWDLESVRKGDAAKEEATKKGIKVHLSNLMSI